MLVHSNAFITSNEQGDNRAVSLQFAHFHPNCRHVLDIKRPYRAIEAQRRGVGKGGEIRNVDPCSSQCADNYPGCPD